MPDLQTPQVGMQPHFIESAPAIKEAEQQTGQIQQGLEQRLQPLEQQRTQIETNISSAQPPVAPPKLQDIPQFQPRQVSQQEMQQFAGLSMALAGLVSLATRRPLTTALSSAASALKGFNDGNFSQAQLDLENFNAQSKAAIEQNSKTMQEYNAILQSQQFTFQQKVDQLRVVAQREQDEIGLASLKKGDIKTFLDANLNRINGFNKYQEAYMGMLAKGGYPVGESVPSNLHGQEYLSTLPEADAAIVKAIDEGRMPLPSGYALRQPYWQNVLRQVAQYDPKFSTYMYPTHAAVQKDFTSGKTAQNITAINTAIGHMGTLYDLSLALQNNDIKAINAAVNRIRTETGDSRINNAQVAISAVGNELMRVFRQVGASEQETQQWEQKFSTSGSPAQMIDAIRTAEVLLQSRIEAVNDQWKRGMGVEEGFPNLISPHSKQTLEHISGVPSGNIRFLGFE